MPAIRTGLWAIVISLAFLSGCAGTSRSMVAGLDTRSYGVELTDVPFHPQVTDQCGPAALATVLNDAGVTVTPGELRPLVYIPDRNGSLQMELIAATRRFGRIPYRLDQDLEAVVAELEAGRPVIVLQNLGAGWAPIWHYAVVVGYLADDKQFVLRSGNERRLLMKAGRFARKWRSGDYWAIVTLEPGELPAHADADRYLRAVAAVESTGDYAAAASAYRAAVARWPDNGLAWLGLGNAAYHDGRLGNAGTAYRHLLDIEPGHAIAANNLSQAYIEQGCREAALATLAAAIARVDAGDPVRPHLIATLEEAEQSTSLAGCPTIAGQDRH